MDKAEIKLKASKLVMKVFGLHDHHHGTGSCDVIEAALTAAHDEGDKAGYARGWNEGVEKTAGYCFNESKHKYEATIRRLKIEKGP